MAKKVGGGGAIMQPYDKNGEYDFNGSEPVERVVDREPKVPKTPKKPKNEVVDVQDKYDILENSNLRLWLESNGVEQKKCEKLPKKLDDKAIVDRLGGGDKTKGSCSSLCLAYVGNKIGLDVLDFRGGDSLQVFATLRTIKEIAGLPGVLSFTTKNINDFKSAEELIPNIESGKDYIFTVGKHAAIVRKSNDGYEFLELQSSTDNGFKKLTKGILKDRFDCKRSHTLYGRKVEHSAVLIDCDSLGKAKDFKPLLSYINTDKDKQNKGADGDVK